MNAIRIVRQTDGKIAVAFGAALDSPRILLTANEARDVSEALISIATDLLQGAYLEFRGT